VSPLALLSLAWQPFHPGVTIWRIFGGGTRGASAALLKYAPGAHIPPHRHEGVEIVVVLKGSQTDEEGTISAGELRVNHPNTGHTVRSEEGCIVLVVWERPVVFEGSESQGS
jgi:anti-sigma factor ChrR (cupin superfamily)